MKVGFTGLMFGLDINVYHGPELGRAYISKSGLDVLAKSPAHFYARHLSPVRPPKQEPTPAMMLGTMTHCAVLEPDKFDDRYAIGPICDRRTKIGKADWAAFQSSLNPGQESVDGEMCSQAKQMADSIRRNEALLNLLNEGDAEVSAFGLDTTTGVAVRVRPDFVSPSGRDGVVLVDVKTTIEASATSFAKTVINYGYDMQAALYSDIYEQASGKSVHGFVFAAVEKDHPFIAAPYMIDADTLERGRRKYKRLLHIYAECLKTNTWPGYTSGGEIQVLTMPAWATQEVV